jgi:N6-L-threonylcarbamoyladenine synthase
MKLIKILGMESSCDDIAFGVIEAEINKKKGMESSGDHIAFGIIEAEINKKKNDVSSHIKILENLGIAQYKSSKFYGGVVPEVAARNHLDNLDIILKDLQTPLEDIDYFAATAGPGMIPGLMVGYTFGETLAAIYKKPFIPVHHMEGHLMAINLMEQIEYPCLSLLISGGHTEIYLCKSFGQYELIINNLDDAVGEVFDKIGKKFNLDFPAGPAMEKLASEYLDAVTPLIPAISLPSFSFSGLKTKCLNMMPYESPAFIAKFLQTSVAATLLHKLKTAIKLTGVNKIYAAGGVASNLYIRQILQELNPIFPPIHLCVDNGLMIAAAAYQHIQHYNKPCNKIDVFPRLSLNEWHSKLYSN